MVPLMEVIGSGNSQESLRGVHGVQPMLQMPLSMVLPSVLKCIVSGTESIGVMAAKLGVNCALKMIQNIKAFHR